MYIYIYTILLYNIYIIYTCFQKLLEALPAPSQEARMYLPPLAGHDYGWSPHYRNRSGVVELFGRDCLLFARVEISSNKIYFLNTYLPPPPAKTHFHLKFWSSNNSNFSTGFFQLFGRGEPTFLRGGATTSKLEFDLCSLCVTHHM